MKYGLLLAALTLSAGQLIGSPSGVLTLVQPTKNARGWHNSPVTIQYLCSPQMHCPEVASLVTEGRSQIVERTATRDGGTEEPVVTSINLDMTAPQVTIETPDEGLVTHDSSIVVVARAIDALSGVTAATCNGVPAPVDSAGVVRCSVPLIPGLNDIAVEASDAADNSGSAAVRVTRVGASAHLHIFPEAAAVLIGRPRTLQVFDDFWQPVPDVVWRVDDRHILEIEASQGNMVTAKSVGRTTVTAIAGSLTASAVVTTAQGPTFPSDTEEWKIGGLRVVTVGPSADKTPSAAEDEFIVATKPPLSPMFWGIGQRTGSIHWTEAAALDAGGRIVRHTAHVLGGVIAVVEASDGSMALVRSGPSTNGANPWRYRSAGRLSEALTQDTDGKIVIAEWDAGGFPRVLVFDGRTGRVVSHLPLPTGLHVWLNADCVAGANHLETVPKIVGTAVVMPDDSLVLEMVHHDDLADEGQCGTVSGHVRRIISVLTIRPRGASAETLGRYEVPAGSSPPTVTLFTLTTDEAGGMFAPWTVRSGRDGPFESHLVHLTADGAHEVQVPAVGEIVHVGGGKAAMTDGATVVAFKLSSGVVEYVRTYTKGPVRIVPGPPGSLYLSFPSGSQELDQFGQPVRKP